MRRNALLDYYLSDDGRGFLVEQSALLAAAACVLLAVFGGSDLDLAVARLFFDTARGKFPGTNNWWLATLLHDDARTAAALALLALIAATAGAWWLPRLGRLRDARHALTFVTATAIAATATVAAAKHLSGHACPWDVAAFGGIAPYRHLFEPHGALPPVRGCFPAAHPLVGFGWLGVCFALWPLARRWAKLSALIALIVGMALGLVQMARGAHFLSHVLWTAWTVWAVNLTLLWIYRRLGARSAHQPHDATDHGPARLVAGKAPQFLHRRDEKKAGGIATDFSPTPGPTIRTVLRTGSMSSPAVDRVLAAPQGREGARP